MTSNTSKWISFLRQYGPIPMNDNMYDETMQRIIKKNKVVPLRIDMIYLDELVRNFLLQAPVSVILSGTAGDGKTFYCREVWKKIGGKESDWDKNKKINEIIINGNKIIIIKDLSELSDNEKEILSLMADSVMGEELNTVFMVAANDGQLLDTWQKITQTDNVCATRKAIEDLLIEGHKEKEGVNIKLYNLSQIDSAILLPKVIKEIIENPGWEECKKCIYSSGNDICPILENKKRLEGEENLIITRLTDLLTLCEINELHIPLRQLFLLVVNMLLGHPEVKENLLKCNDIPKIFERNSTYLASIYRNIFGENLPERKRSSINIFGTLSRFGIGTETNTLIDNILIFGEDDSQYYELFKTLVLSDKYYGADMRFISEKKAYLEGDIQDKEKFLEMLKSQRQRLFFVIPRELEERLKLWNLTTFQFAGEFLNEVYRLLLEQKRISSHYITRIVKGLNRITTGLLVEDKDELILSTSGNYSQAKVSRVLEEFISVKQKRGEFVKFELDEGNQKLYLSVGFTNDFPPVKLHLHLVRYEFISRVAEGALPGNFSRECYEDILAFKSKLLKRLEDIRKAENEDEDSLYSLRLLKVNEKGSVEHKTLEVF